MGFTLIELMVVITIVAIVMTIGVPALRLVIADTRVRVAASDFAGDIAFARASAIASGYRAIIEPLPAGSNWVSGYQICTATVSGATTCAGGAGQTLKIASAPAANVKICTKVAEFQGAAGNIIFRPDGSVVRTSAQNATDGMTVSAIVDGNIADDKIRTLYFGPSGRITVILQNGGTNGGGLGVSDGAGAC
jgi:prepilin-type N-terminal cleavage/methylation domain-containing protein